MNLDNIYELLEYLLDFEGKDFEKTYDVKELKIIRTPDHDLTEVIDLIEYIDLWGKEFHKDSELNPINHIYYNCLTLLKDYLNEI